MSERKFLITFPEVLSRSGISREEIEEKPMAVYEYTPQEEPKGVKYVRCGGRALWERRDEGWRIVGSELLTGRPHYTWDYLLRKFGPLTEVPKGDAIDAEIERLSKEMGLSRSAGSGAKYYNVGPKPATSGYVVIADCCPAGRWHPGADDYVVTEHGHLRIKQGHKNLAEYATWSAVKWEEREK